VEHGQHALAEHLEPQRVVVAHLARDDQVRVRVLEHAVPGPGAHGDGADAVAAGARGGGLGPHEHDALHAQLGGVGPHDAREVRVGGELHAAAVAGALEPLRDGRLDGLHDGHVPGGGGGGGDGGDFVEDAGQPVVDAAEDGVDGGVGAVDGDVVLGQAQDDALVRVVEVEGLEPAEDKGVFCYWSVCRQWARGWLVIVR